jgi:hypothetical protein
MSTVSILATTGVAILSGGAAGGIRAMAAGESGACAAAA